jgi:hypothetical protein
MPFTAVADNAALAAIGAVATFISLHIADPDGTGGNEVTGGTYARVATTWSTPAAGSMPGTQATINVPAGTTISHWGLWTVVSGGVYYLGFPLQAPQNFASAGTYLLTPTLAAQG